MVAVGLVTGGLIGGGVANAEGPGYRCLIPSVENVQPGTVVYSDGSTGYERECQQTLRALGLI